MKLAITPLQRWNLRELIYSEGAPKVKGGQEGRRLRRFCRHVGLDVIALAIIAGTGANGKSRVSVKQITNRVPALFELDEDDRDRILALSELERSPAAEEVLGPLFDACEDWKAGREVVQTLTAAEAPAPVLDFDASQEDWKAPPEGSEDDPE